MGPLTHLPPEVATAAGFMDKPTLLPALSFHRNQNIPSLLRVAWQGAGHQEPPGSWKPGTAMCPQGGNAGMQNLLDFCLPGSCGGPGVQAEATGILGKVGQGAVSLHS